MFTENQIKGSLNTPDRKLLYDIRELLIEQNQLLRKLTSENNQETVDIKRKRRKKEELK